MLDSLFLNLIFHSIFFCFARLIPPTIFFYSPDLPKCLVNAFPESNGGGLGNALLGPALFHADPRVRSSALALLRLVQSFDATAPALDSLAPLARWEMAKGAV